MNANDSAASLALTREGILNALQALSDELGKQGVTGELCLFGGTVMVLAFTARLSTKDVDAIFQPTQLLALYYPANRIPPKTQYLVEGLFEEGKL